MLLRPLVLSCVKFSTRVLVLIVVIGTAFWLAVPEPTTPTTASSPKDLPDGWYQVLRRDGILPVYNPAFVSGDDANWPRDTLVIGVEVNGDARAYPVSFLNRREMVNDVVGGEPLLVSW